MSHIFPQGKLHKHNDMCEYEINKNYRFENFSNYQNKNFNSNFSIICSLIHRTIQSAFETMIYKETAQPIFTTN